MIKANQVHRIRGNQLTKLLWAAGDAILEIYRQNAPGVEIKADSSPVTQADLAANRILMEGLALITPDVPVVSEEDPSSLEIPQSQPVYWLIDPLDGTKEFIQKNGQFTCNVALIEYGRATFGLVGVPAQQLIYIGGPGLGAHRIHLQGSQYPIHVAPVGPIIRVIASRSHMNTETSDFIASLDRPVELVQAGSSLKFLKIAEGEADLYPRLGPTCEWDTAAAHAVLEGAGGTVAQLDGTAMCYGKDSVLNPYFVARGQHG